MVPSLLDWMEKHGAKYPFDPEDEDAYRDMGRIAARYLMFREEATYKLAARKLWTLRKKGIFAVDSWALAAPRDWVDAYMREEA